MSDECFKPDEQPTVPDTPCRLYVAPGRPDYVSTEEIDAFTEWHAKHFGCGKVKPKEAGK